MKRVGPSDIFFLRGGGGGKKISPHPYLFFRVSTCHVSQRSRLAKKKSPRQEKSHACLQISHATARANAGAWWPCWPLMVGHGSRRPAAQPEAHEWISAWLRVPPHTPDARARVAPNSSLVPLKVAARARERCAAPGLGLGLRVRVRARARAGWLGLGLG